MPSADFSCAIPPPLGSGSFFKQHKRSPRVMHTPLPAHPHPIYTATLRVRIGLQRYSPSDLHRCASYVVFVHCGSGLPAASFRLRLATDALAVRLALPLTGRAGDLNPQGCAPCRAHEAKSRCLHRKQRLFRLLTAYPTQFGKAAAGTSDTTDSRSCATVVRPFEPLAPVLVPLAMASRRAFT